MVKNKIVNLSRGKNLTSGVECQVVYNCFFLRKLVRQLFTDMTSFCMQFEKGNVGYCGRLSGVRGSVLLTDREGKKENTHLDLALLFLLLEVMQRLLDVNNPPHSRKLPAVTHVPFFQTACKMTSRGCVIA